MSEKTDHISDPEVRRLFEAGEANGTLEYLYTTTPVSVAYYVFIRRDENGDPHDEKMTKISLIAAYGSPR